MTTTPSDRLPPHVTRRYRCTHCDTLWTQHPDDPAHCWACGQPGTTKQAHSTPRDQCGYATVATPEWWAGVRDRVLAEQEAT